MSKNKKFIMIGGSIGSVSSAAKAYLQSDDIDINMYEKSSTTSFFPCLSPYVIGKETTPDLAVVFGPEKIEELYPKLHVFVKHEVIKVNTDKKEVTVKNLKTGEIFKDWYDKLMIDSGHTPRPLPFPGLDKITRLFPLKFHPDMVKIIEALEKYKPKRAIIIGAGIIGLELAENIRNNGVTDITIFEAGSDICPVFDSDIAKRLQDDLEKIGNKIFVNTCISTIEQIDDEIVITDSFDKKHYADIGFFAIGGFPATSFLKNTNIALNDFGAVQVNDYMQSISNPDVFAAGDVIEHKHVVSGKPYSLALASPAIRGAHVAGYNMTTEDKSKWWKFKGFFGSTIVGIHKKVIARTGLNENELKRLKMPYLMQDYTCTNMPYGIGFDHEELTVKCLFDPITGKLYGGSAYGGISASRQVDVMATMLAFNGTVNDMRQLELAYSPLFNLGKSPLARLGLFSTQKLEKLHKEGGKVIIEDKDINGNIKDFRAYVCKVIYDNKKNNDET